MSWHFLSLTAFVVDSSGWRCFCYICLDGVPFNTFMMTTSFDGSAHVQLDGIRGQGLQD